MERVKKIVEKTADIANKATEQVKVKGLQLHKKILGAVSTENNINIKRAYGGELYDSKGHWLTNDEMQYFKESKIASDRLYNNALHIFPEISDIYRDRDQEEMLDTQITLKEYKETVERVKINAILAQDHYCGETFSHGNREKMMEQFEADCKRLSEMNEKLQHALKDKENITAIRKSLGHLDPIGVTRQDGLVTIDLAKFDPYRVYLPNLDLSNGLNDFKYDISQVDQKKFTNTLSKDELGSLNEQLNFTNNCLKDGYIFNTYVEHPKLYRKALEYYIYLKIVQNIKKAYPNRDLKSGFTSVCELLTENKMKRILMQSEEREQSKSSQLDQKKKTNFEQPRDKPKPNLLFSNNQAERDFAIEKGLTNVYIYQRKEEQQREGLHKKIQELVGENMKAEEGLPIIRDINTKFRDAAMSNPELYRPALKEAIKRTRTLYQWATKFQDQFNLDEDWVGTGMKQLGITKDNFTASLDKLLHNKLVNDEITGNSLSVDAIVNGDTDTKRPPYDKTKIVEHFEEFTRANAMLNSIHGLLKEGIPVREIPRQIKGLERVLTSGDENNCLIYALVKVGQPNFNMNDNQQAVSSIRAHLKIKMEQKVQLERKNVEGKLDKDQGATLTNLQDRCEAVKNGSMLDLGSYDGEELIKYLRNSKLLEGNRGVLVYKFENGKIGCFEQVPPSFQDTSSQEKPYTLFLQQDFHFEAMIEPQK